MLVPVYVTRKGLVTKGPVYGNTCTKILCLCSKLYSTPPQKAIKKGF